VFLAQAIREGSLDATLSQNPLTMAAQSVKYVAQYLDGKKTGIPQHAYWPHLLLTKANVDSAQAKAYGLWGDDVSKAK
jgi:ribose transport system substrate-binding protein